MPKIKHGKEPARLYRIWENMRNRCNNKNNHDYSYYGKRGISVCDEWADFCIFRDWSLSHGYADNLTIDRVDNDAGYSPENCRWVTKKTQQRNKRNNVLYRGKTLSEWAELLNIQKSTLYHRIRRRGWSIDKALSTPVR